MKTSGSGIKNNNMSNRNQHKPINRKFRKRKVYSSFVDNILGADLADI